MENTANILGESYCFWVQTGAVILSAIMAVLAIKGKNYVIFGILSFLVVGITFFYAYTADKNNFTNWLMAIGSIISAAGLVYFSYLSYEFQKKSVFQTQFNILFEQLIRMKKDCLTDKDDLDSLIKDTLVNLGINQDIELAISSITSNYRYSIFCIMLYRIISIIDKEYQNNIDAAKQFTGILRASIEHNLMLLIAFNSLIEQHSHYKELIEKYSLLEHLPLVNDWLYVILEKQHSKFKTKECLDGIKNNIINAFKENAWGDNKYIQGSYTK